MSSLLSAELAATCNALGYFDAASNKYYADSNTLETVKDLIRYLRRDDATRDIRRQLGDTKVLQTDLLPLLKSYWEETALFDVLLRLIVNLTTPALILWNEEIPTDKTTRNQYLQIEEHLQCYKEAFADEGVWAVLSTRLSRILELDYTERGDENNLILERILMLIRNILYVPADAMERRPDNDASIHDQVLWALHQSGMLDILLYITSSTNEQIYYMHILEILSYMLREQKPSELATAAVQRSQTEKIRDEAELLAIRHRENSQKQKKTKMYSGTRHSRFGGTFVVKSMKSISDNELIYHKPLNKLDALNFDADKKKPKTPKNRLPIVSASSDRRSAFTIRLFLKEFCVELLNGAYNTLMYHVKDNLVRAKAQTHDESYYLWALRFFMEFNRGYKFEVKLVSETMSVQSFHFVQQQSENFFDLMQTDKKKIRLWSRRLHLALLAYRELFLTLCAMDKSPDGTVRDSAKVIKSNIFYVPEYREFVLTLLVNYNELKMSDAYLKDLMETQHIFLKMFEHFCASGSIVVQKKSKGRNRKTKKDTTSTTATQPMQLNLETMWDEVASQISALLEAGGEFFTTLVPFDAASDVPIDDQKADAMKNIQRKLRGGEFEQAVGLLRAAREVWPENDSFGTNNMAPEEEFLALRDIFWADLGENTVKPVDQSQIEDQEDYDEEEENEVPQYAETDFTFDEFIKRLPHPKIVRACGLALRDFETNSVNTNHCIVKLLHRIAFDCKMYVMVFQLSIFRTFQRIFAAKNLPEYKELVKFATFIVRQFLKVAESNNKVFIEVLFWKSKKEAYEIEAGYGETEKTSSIKVWSEEDEDELRRLFMEHQQNNIEDDVVDWIVENLIDHTRTRRSVMKKLKEMHLLRDGYKTKSSKAKIPQSWGSAEESQLRELWDEYKDAMNPLDLIMNTLEIKRPKNRVIEKMLVMGLIQDKKEVRKKRVTSKRGGKSKARGTEDTDEEDNIIFTKQKKIPKQKIPRAALAKVVLDNMEAGHREAIEWFKEFLSDSIDDFVDDDMEGLPLVPIAEYAITAMENDTYKQMLKAFGICEPSEQQAYWRLPASLSKETMKQYCDLLQQALDNNLSLENIPEENNQADDTDSSDSSRLVQQKNNKMRKPKGNQESSSDSDGSIPSTFKLANKKPVSKTRKGGNKKNKLLPKVELSKLVLRQMQSGHQDALKWFQECLSDAIEDYEDEDFEGIPLVPIMDYAQAAMENSQFKQMLKSFGIKEPSDEQEIYWRIPNSLTMDNLKNHVNLLQEALSNNLTIEDEKRDESSDEDYLETLKRLRSNEKSQEPNEPRPVTVDSADLDLDSLGNDNSETNESQNMNDINDADKTISQDVMKVQKSRGIVDSDSESEVADGNSVIIETNESKRIRSISDSDDNDTDKPIRKKSRVIDSDDE